MPGGGSLESNGYSELSWSTIELMKTPLEDQIQKGFDRAFELIKLFLSLAVGGVVFIAAFIQKPPGVALSKWLVLASLALFLTAAGLFWYALDKTMSAEVYLRREDAVRTDESFEAAYLAVRIGRVCFFLAVASMALLGALVVIAWP